MSELYKFFARNMGTLDFSDEALLNLYNAESYGVALTPKNGFAVGKQYLNLHVTMWKEDIAAGLLWKFELYKDPLFEPFHWWLDSIFS